MIGIALMLAGAAMPMAEQAAVYRAAGATRRGGQWMLCAEEPQPEGLGVDLYRDLNADGRPEALLSEGGSFCYGATGMGYALVSKQPDGSWRLLSAGAGIGRAAQDQGGGRVPGSVDRRPRLLLPGAPVEWPHLCASTSRI
jgi:hypothetical protein